MSGNPDNLIILTHQGYAALASIHLAQRFPELERFDPEVQAILSPLFHKAMALAVDRTRQGLFPLHPETSKL